VEKTVDSSTGPCDISHLVPCEISPLISHAGENLDMFRGNTLTLPAYVLEMSSIQVAERHVTCYTHRKLGNGERQKWGGGGSRARSLSMPDTNDSMPHLISPHHPTHYMLFPSTLSLLFRRRYILPGTNPDAGKNDISMESDGPVTVYRVGPSIV
jgi:hypothetical protein